MTHLLLIKHSLPEILPHLPAREWHLSAEGRARAAALAQQLAPYQLDALYSSIEPKARETAEILSAHLGLPFETAEGLHEHERARVGYLSQREFEARVAELYARPSELVLGEETADAAHTRFASAVSRILAAHREQTVGIVAHGTVIALYAARAARFAVAPFDLWKRLGLPAAVVFALPKLELARVIDLHPQKF